MLERDRLTSKKISKTDAVRSQLGHELPADAVHIGPSDYVPWLADRKWAHIRLEGRGFGDQPINVELKLEVWDSPNSAGRRHRRHPLLQDRARSRDQGRPAGALGLPDEVAARAVDRRHRPAAARAVHRRRRVGCRSLERIGRPSARLVRLACARPALTVAHRGRAGDRLASSTRSPPSPSPPRRARSCRRASPTSSASRSTTGSSAISTSIAIVVEAPSLPEATVYAEPARPRAAARRKVPLKQHRLPDRPQAVRGARRCSICRRRSSREIRERIFDYQEFMEAFAARPTLDQLVDGMATQIATAFVVELHRPRPLRRQGRRRSAVRPGSRRPDLGAARSAGAVPVAVRDALRGRRRRQSGRRLLPVRGPAPALHPGRAGDRARELHRRPARHRGHPRRDRARSSASSPTSRSA